MTQKADSFPWNFYTQIHEVVKGEVFVATAETLGAINELAFKEVGENRVIPLFVVVGPLGTLLLRGQLVIFEFFVDWFGGDPIELIMHPIEQKPHKFLRILLIIATEGVNCA